MLNKYKFIPTKEQSIKQTIVSVFLIVYSILFILINNTTLEFISIWRIVNLISCFVFFSVFSILCFNLYCCIFLKNSLYSIDVVVNLDKINK